MIYGSRVRQVRKMRRLTQVDLASIVQATQYQISRIEAGLMEPPEAVADAIAKAVDFPVAFLRKVADTPEVPFGTLDFRARRSLAKVDLEQAHAWGEMAFECAWRLSANQEPPAVVVPSLNADFPQEAARLTRSALGLGPHSPVKNVTHAMESAGIWLIALPVSLEGRDAFSAWISTPERRVPFVAVLAGTSTDRERRSKAHELGHLVMHKSPSGSVADMESEADTFASEFLTPADAIADQLRPPLRIATLLELKHIWGVSVQSLIMRAADLDLISERRKQQMFQWIGINWGRRSEPHPLPAEKPRVFKKLAEGAYGDPPNVERFAQEASLPKWVAARMLELHASRHEVRSTVHVSDERPPNVVPIRRPPA